MMRQIDMKLPKLIRACTCGEATVIMMQKCQAAEDCARLVIAIPSKCSARVTAATSICFYGESYTPAVLEIAVAACNTE